MKQLSITLGLALLLAPLPALAQSGRNPAVDKVRAAYAQASDAGNLAALVALFTNDAVVMPPNHPMVKGKAAIETFHKGLFDSAKVSNVMITATQTACMTNSCYDIGTYSQMVTPKDGTGSKETGKYMVVLNKEADGSMKIAYEIWNADSPPPMPHMMMMGKPAR